MEHGIQMQNIHYIILLIAYADNGNPTVGHKYYDKHS